MTDTFTYKQVEKALATVHGVAPALMGAFRGRIKHLQRLKIVPESPGRGKKIAYEFKDVLRWALYLELAEYGVDPVRIQIVLGNVEDYAMGLLLIQQRRRDPDIFLCFRPSMSLVWECSLEKGLTEYAKNSRRFGAINLSELRRQVLDVLVEGVCNRVQKDKT